jgi:hypothetical protein
VDGWALRHLHLSVLLVFHHHDARALRTRLCFASIGD